MYNTHRFSASGPAPAKLEQRRNLGQLTELSEWIVRLVPEKSDRDLISYRIASKLSGIRRGRLRLPRHFPEEVLRMEQLGKSQLLRAAYSVGSASSIPLNKREENYLRQVLPGGIIRTCGGSVSAHKRQAGAVRLLRLKDWPRLATKPSWPSSPTLGEWMEMSRVGAPPALGFRKEEHGSAVRYCITMAQLKGDLKLASRIVSQQIVGIRADIEIPRKFLRYFSYRWGFLILTVRWSLPAGLVRFLLARWKTGPSNLWLEDKCRLKTFLRTNEVTSFGCTVEGPW